LINSAIAKAKAPEHRIGEHGLIIVEADKHRAAPPARGRVEAVDERLHRGIMREGDEQNRGRQQ
jgi:hypothetical protein